MKKRVKDVCTLLTMECLLKTLQVSGDKKDRLDKIVGDVLDLRDDFVSRISHTEPGNVKGYYRKFHEDFSNKVENVAGELDKLCD